MGLTATTQSSRKPGPQKVKVKGAALRAILDQLDSEWETLKQGEPEHWGDDAGLLAYYHAVLRPALPWIDGDPYTWQPPEEFAGQRLAKLCRWLAGLQHAERIQVKQARETMLGKLRECWPAYRDLAVPDVPNGQSILYLEVLPFTWEGIETLWQGQNWEGDGPAVFLPQFAAKESEDFHLAALAVLFLNLSLKYYATDLKAHPADVDGLGSKGRN